MKSYRVTEFEMPLEMIEVPTPKPSGTEVLLRVKAVGVCHSDLHIWEGGYDLGHGKRMSLKDRGIPLPLTMGHETAGEVIALGPQAENVKIGEVQGVYCDGCYADHIVVPHPRYLLDLQGLDPVTAAPYACSGLTTYSALRKVADVLEREPILIIGAGGLGLMALSLLKAMGGKGAIAVDIDARKRQAALEAGAIAAVDVAAADARRQITQAAGAPIRAAIDLVGSEQTAALGFDCLPKGGKLVIVGLFGGAAPWSLPLIPIKAATIQGSYVGSLAELKALLDLVRRKSVPPIPVTKRPLHQAQQSLEDLRNGKLVGRAVLTP